MRPNPNTGVLWTALVYWIVAVGWICLVLAGPSYRLGTTSSLIAFLVRPSTHF
jgi:hypothetical protein